MITLSSALLAFFNSRPQNVLCAELYTVTLRPGLYSPAGATLRWTSSLYAISLGGNLYSPGPPNFKHASLRVETGLKTSDLEITIEADDSYLLNGVPLLARIARGEWNFATIEIERAYSAGPGQPWIDKVPRFMGIVTDIGDIGRISVPLTVKSVSYLLDTQWPKDTIMSTCGKVLYSTDCGALASTHQVSGAVQSTPASPTVNGFGTTLTLADSYFVGGTITFTSGNLAGLSYWVRSYLHANGIVRLQTPALVAPSPGDTFTILPGCDKSQTTCSSRFGNLSNFGGFPYVPQPTASF